MMGSPGDAKMPSIPAPSSKAFSREAFAVLKIYTSIITTWKTMKDILTSAQLLYETNEMWG